MAKINGYNLSRKWFDFAFENKEAKCYHTAIYMWCIELNNRLGWPMEFGLPTHDTMVGLSIGNKNTYLLALQDLKKWGFIQIISDSKNQFSSKVISLSRIESEPALIPALHTAVVRNSNSSRSESEPINKQYKTNNTGNNSKKGRNTNHPLVNYFGYEVGIEMPPEITDPDQQLKWVICHCRKAARDLACMQNAPDYYPEDVKRGKWKHFYDQETLEFKYHICPLSSEFNLPEE